MKYLYLSFLASFISISSFAIIGPISGGNAVCAGSTITLADTTTGGVWSSSNTAIATVGSLSGIVTGVAAGTASITYTAGTSYVTAGISVNPLPTAFTVTGGGNYCAGGSGLVVGLSGSTLGTNYTLYYAGAVVSTIAGGSGAINFGLQTAAGSYIIVATNTLTGCSKTMTGSASITINPSPLPITGPSAVCIGATITPSDGMPGGTWNSSNPSIATIGASTGIVTGISSGAAIITYVLPTGCYITNSVIVAISPGAITGASTVCVGATSTISDGVPGGTWSCSPSTIASLSAFTGLLTGISPGTSVVYYSLGTGCTVTKIVTVNPIPGPTTGTPLVCIGYTTTISDATPGGIWSSTNPAIATVGFTTGLVTGFSPGLSIIQYTIPTGCYINTVVTVNSVSIPIMGLSSVCVGNSTTLSDALGGGTWSSSNPAIASINYTGIITGVAAGAATITYAPGTGCTATYAVTVNPGSPIASHSIISPPDSICSSPDFYISACGTSSSYNVTTWFGDGTSVNTALTATGICHADVLHSYNTAGTYFVKQVLYLGTVALDSVSFSYEYLLCRTLPVKFYFDANGDCVFDSGDKQLLLPVTSEIDSNGIAIDTISATSGFYYKALGAPGTVYTFRVISIASGLHVTCPMSGVIYDTIQPTVYTYHQKYFGVNCSGGGGYDLEEHVATNTGRHTQWGTIIVNNTFCVPEDADVTLHFSPRYNFTSATPPPTSYSGNTATWHLTAVSSDTPSYPLISYYLDVPGPAYVHWLTPGDTVTSSYITLGTTTGDIDTSNNVITKNDTVVSSFDPNEISVIPSGVVLPCTKLQYTIGFENTGNDTAHNITIMDTLSDNLDAKSLTVEIASSVMNISIIKNGTNNIAKFDLPNINLLDSAHSRQCNGMLVFNIKTKSGLADGSTIFNQAGIFFDDNPAVLTNIVENVTGISPVTGSNIVCVSAHDTLSNLTAGGIWSMSNTRATISAGIVTGAVAGLDTAIYTVSSTCTSKTATKIITINPLPYAGTVTGANNVCESSSITLSDTATGGTWGSSYPTIATVSLAGVVNGISGGTTTISYTQSNSCGSAYSTKSVTVNPLPAAITGSTSVCIAATIPLADTTTGGTWSSGNPSIATIGSVSGVTTGINAGTPTLTYLLPTGCLRTYAITVNPLPALYHVTGGGNYCSGGSGTHIGLSGSSTGTDYMLYYGATATGTFPGTGSVLDFGLQTLAGSYTVSATNTATTCQNNMADSAVITIDPSVTASVSLTAAPGDNLCAGTTATFTPIPVNGGAMPLYQWSVNGTSVAIGGTYSFLPANGDVVQVILTSNAPCAVTDTASSAISMSVDLPLTPSVAISANPGLSISSGDNVTLTTAVSGYGTAPEYQWVLNGTYIAGATDATYTSNAFADNDMITCIITTGNVCGNVTASNYAYITVNTTGIRIIPGAGKEVEILPNPNKGTFTIAGTFAGLKDEEMTILVTDMLGQEVYRKKTILQNGTINMPVMLNSSLANGMYMLNVNPATGNEVFHFVIGK